MNSTIRLRLILVAGALVLLGGCSSMRTETHAGAGAQADSMDMKAMCEKHKQMMAGKSQQEQQSMMQEHMKSMSPEMRERMQSMMKQCH
jgi:uncharacterized protein YceK